MKLRNKKTGEIIEFDAILAVKDVKDNSAAHLEYPSLAKFYEEWEDVPEEPKSYWYIDCYGNRLKNLANGNEWDDLRESIGNYFETQEEAERAVKKLRAWKRLRDKGFKFKGWHELGHRASVLEGADNVVRFDGEYDENDLDLLFGGEDGQRG